MRPSDYLIDLILSVIMIIGAYQFYFWCQRQAFRPTRQLGLRLDERFPYWPAWVWVYSFLYYPMILVLNFVVDSPRQFTHMAAGFVLLLGVQMACFLVFPVTTPEQWRHLNQKRGTSERFLALVHRFDATSNCFPSMHVSVAMLTAMYLAPHLGHGAFAFPLLIAVSCIFTKQHYLVDLPVGAVLGWGVFHFTSLLEVVI